MGQSKAQKEYNKQMAQNAKDQYQLQRDMFEYTKAGTPEQQRFQKQSADWDTWVKGHNYGAPPPDSILNFDLYSPAHQQQQTQRMANIQGIGAAAMGGTGDQSIALAQTREHLANQAGEMSANAYEQAIKQNDAYYKGQNLGYAQLGAQTNLGLTNNATSSAQFFFDQQRQTLPPSFMQTWGPLIGGAIGAAGSMLGPGFAAGGMFNKR